VSTAASVSERAFSAPPRWRADVSLALVALIWGTTFVVVKSALAEISAVLFLALRFGLAALCMAALFARSFRRTNRTALVSGLRGGALAGLFLWCGYVLQTFGLKYTTAGKSGFITGLYIVLVPLIGAVLYRRVPRLLEMIGILFATAGLLLLTLPSLELRINLGDALTVGSALAFAIHLVLLGHYAQRENVEALALGQIAGAALLSGAALGVEAPRVHWSVPVLIAVVLTGVSGTAAAFAIQTWAQRFTSATRTAIIFALEPVFALLTAVALTGERVALASMVGGSLILGGILLVELKPGGRDTSPRDSSEINSYT
jgi:drug/metabolite transporter (DMT)-like permease